MNWEELIKENIGTEKCLKHNIIALRLQLRAIKEQTKEFKENIKREKGEK